MLTLVAVTLKNAASELFALAGGAPAAALRSAVAAAVGASVLDAEYGGAGALVLGSVPFVVNASDAGGNGSSVFNAATRRRVQQLEQTPGRNASTVVTVALLAASAVWATRLQAALSADAAAFGAVLTARLRAADPRELGIVVATLGASGLRGGGPGGGDSSASSAVDAGAPLTIGEVSGVAVGAAAFGFGVALLVLRRRQRLQARLEAANAAEVVAALTAAGKKAEAAAAAAAASAATAAAAAESSASAAAASALASPAAEGRASAIELDLTFLDEEAEAAASAAPRAGLAATMTSAATPRATQTPLRPRHAGGGGVGGGGLVLRQPGADFSLGPSAGGAFIGAAEHLVTGPAAAALLGAADAVDATAAAAAVAAAEPGTALGLAAGGPAAETPRVSTARRRTRGPRSARDTEL